MHDGYDTRETWPFECLSCLHVWQEEYVVRHVTDDYGNEITLWQRSGVTVQPPSSDTCCPGCGAYHVTSFPTGYLSRHPELVPAPVPEPVAEARVVPVVARRDPTARAPLPARLLLAVGVPVALFVAYELYENAIRVAHSH
ncbi:hypothetical protein [Nonomuraea rhizosphaerae]|uniref:hypothetical protein n=1 Tax=Nonomuraea rhizosphaerae TaxID=2665663 RepID=UPI001C5DF8A4|nr:hypothetical protein [Nonomuraea rhizosphaerae]